jgi:REP element-mobilizing transposase RayT
MLGWHLIFSAYGFWLPNDERGSGSSQVRAQHIYDAGGEATKVQSRHSVAARPYDRERQRRTREALKYPAVVLTGSQARAAALGIGSVSAKIELVIHACAMMPEHAHLVVGAHRLSGEELMTCLKSGATRGMNDAGLHPMREHARANGRLPTPWAARGWKVILPTRERMRKAFRYAELNPIRAGLRPQRWSFVVPFVG